MGETMKKEEYIETQMHIKYINRIDDVCKFELREDYKIYIIERLIQNWQEEGV